MTGPEPARSISDAWSVRRIASRTAEGWKNKDFHLPNDLKHDQ